MKELIEKKNDLITRAESIVNTAKSEKRELTDAEATELTELRDSVKKITRDLGLMDDVEEIGREKAKEEKKKEGEAKMKKTEAMEERSIEIRERQAFENYIRGFTVHERAATGTGNCADDFGCAGNLSDRSGFVSNDCTVQLHGNDRSGTA